MQENGGSMNPIPLEDRPFRALQILLQHAPEAVTREELQKQLWPADVFIDFDHGGEGDRQTPAGAQRQR